MWDVEVSTVLLCWSCNDHRPASIGAEVFYLNDNTGDPRLEQTERHNIYLPMLATVARTVATAAALA